MPTRDGGPLPAPEIRKFAEPMFEHYAHVGPPIDVLMLASASVWMAVLFGIHYEWRR